MVFKALMILIAIYVLIYTISYGIWEVKRGNKLAGVSVFVLCVLVAAMPIVSLYFIE